MTNLKLLERLPRPTTADWSAQIDWIFDEVATLSDWTDITQDNCRSIKKRYLEFISGTIGENPVELEDLWNELSLMEWRDYLLARVQKNELGGKTAATWHNMVGQVMRQAYYWDITTAIPIHIGIPRDVTAQRTSDFTQAFDFDYLESIQNVLRRYIVLAKKFTNPYERKNVGKDPRGLDLVESQQLGRNRRMNIQDDRGWVTWENVVWFFEHEFDAKVPHPQDFRNPKYDYFTNAVTSRYQDLETVWDRLGVLSWHKRQEIIFALVFCLANELGLNLSSLKSLKVDCYQEEHELTKQPYLRYFKARSGGEKELHFPIFNDAWRAKDATIEEQADGESSYLWINDRKARKAKEIIDLLLALTAEIRERDDFPKEYKDKLIIWLQARSPKDHRYGCMDDYKLTSNRIHFFVKNKLKPAIIKEVVERMKNKTPNNQWAAREKEIRNDLNAQSFTVARFRATIATEMVKNGAGLEDIQAFLGHANLSTTITYIRQHDLEVTFFRDMSEYLERIKQNSTAYSLRKKDEVEVEGIDTEPPVYETGLSFCLDPFNPSSNVKKNMAWKKGQSCKIWNRCLFCDKILITSNSLPKLFAYRTKLELTLSSLSISAHKATPMFRAVALIDAIETNRVFSAKEMARARIASETIDYDLLDMMLVDGLKKNKN